MKMWRFQRSHQPSIVMTDTEHQRHRNFSLCIMKEPNISASYLVGKNKEMYRTAGESKRTSLSSKGDTSLFSPVLPTNGVPGEGKSYLPCATPPTIRQLSSFSVSAQILPHTGPDLPCFCTLENQLHLVPSRLAWCKSVGGKPVALR